jgi:gamma-glutamylcyclotransferase (GGCT)/AIG2-like uncharacterized protein YtfP
MDPHEKEFVFVYGTLRRDMKGKMYRLMAKHGSFVDEATYQGRLYKVASYPGVVPSDDPKNTVHGEVYQLHHADAVLPCLDQYEGCGPGFPEPTEYIRAKQEVSLRNGNAVSAWVYLYNRPTEALESIESGDFSQVRSRETK